MDIDETSLRRRMGESVAAVRIANGVSQADLAERMGVAQPNISRQETTGFVSFILAHRYERAIGARPGSIFYAAGLVPKPPAETGTTLETLIAADTTIDTDTRDVLLSILAISRRGQ